MSEESETMDFDRDKIVASFLAESEEGLDLTEQQLIAAETDPGNLELLDEVFRVAHTIKGNASALDFPELAGFNCPEWSHLSAGDSVEFTRRLVPHLRAALQM